MATKLIDDVVHKVCIECGEWKPQTLDNFYYRLKLGKYDEWNARCRPCLSTHGKAKREERGWFADRRTRLKRQYNLELSQYLNILILQNGVCKICKRTDPSDKALAVDHDHDCCPGRTSCGKCVRGLLCGPCNKMLGYLNDDVQRLNDAKRYLEMWR